MSSPVVVGSIAEIRRAVRNARSLGNDIALVPTMGALHEGHLSLVRAAKEKCGTVVTSIFVNPTQFAPNEDYARYPRDLETDLRKLENEGVDFVFVPSEDEVYPNGSFGTFVDVPEISNRLDGESRPGHFRGVATIVAKLFHIVSPDYAFFGQKDAAQLAVLRAMVLGLDFPLHLIACPTVRELDGIAMSSRNKYLRPDERSHAALIYKALCAARDAVANGVADVLELRRLLMATIQSDSMFRIDYVEIVHPDSLLPVHSVSGVLIAVAVWIGQTRLIDNILLPTVEVKV